jgi:rubrerythrin
MSSAAQTWEREEGVTCVVCPTCGFTFDEFHTDADGGYSCPVCAEARVTIDVATGVMQHGK